MRTLKFIVEGLIIKQDPNCDFENLVPGTDGYLEAEFTFSDEWNGFVKAASFFSPLGFEYPARLLRNGVVCDIPKEALAKRSFKIQIVGQCGSITMHTDKVEVKQNGGKV